MRDFRFFKTRLILFAALPGFLFSSCEKDNSAELKAKEQRLLEHYLLTNNITTPPTESGLYFIETLEGTGAAPEENNMIILNYTLKLIDGKVIATSNKTIAESNGLSASGLFGPTRTIYKNFPRQGLMEGISLMKEGGQATLIIPSELAYGSSGYPSAGIDPYSTLIYVLELIKVVPDPDAYEHELIAAYLDTTSTEVADSTVDGLYHIVDVAGTGDLPQNNTSIELKYKLYLIDGRKIGESGTTPMNYTIGSPNYIPGWEKGLKLVRKGEKCRIIIPWYEAYGAGGYQIIPPYSTLLYYIERTE